MDENKNIILILKKNFSNVLDGINKPKRKKHNIRNIIKYFNYVIILFFFQAILRVIIASKFSFIIIKSFFLKSIKKIKSL